MSYLSKAITLGLIVGIFGLIISAMPLGLKLEENLGLYVLFKLRGSRPAPPEVVVVAIDKASADKMNVDAQPKKWPRSIHASLTDTLSESGASVIAFDLFFNESRSTSDDMLFAKAIQSAGNVVLSEYLKQEVITDERGNVIDNLHAEKLVLPIPDFEKPAAAVASFPLPKYPHRVNQYWTFKTAAGDVPTVPPVAFQIFASEVYKDFIMQIDKHRSHEADALSQERKLINSSAGSIGTMKTIRNSFEKDPSIAEKILAWLSNAHAPPLDSERSRIVKSLIQMYQSPDTLYLNFYGPPRTITTIPYYQALQSNKNLSDGQNQFDFRGKAVFVGLSENMQSERRNDSHYTVFSQPDGVDISGVEIAATAFANLLEDMPLQPLASHKQFIIIFLYGLFLGIIFDRLFPSVISLKDMILPLIAACLWGILYFTYARYQFKTTGIWYPVVVPFLQMPAAFFVSIIMRNIHTERTGYAIYLHSDIRGYTAFSENRDPEYLKKLMHSYFRQLSRTVDKYSGVIEATPGDAMLARWEVKSSGTASRKQRTQACLASLGIKKKTVTFIQSSREQLSTHIGLHAGRTSRGNIATRQQRKNISFGGPVNTVQRVEEFNKCLGTEILMSEEMLNQLEGFLTREVGKFALKGISRPLLLHELLCTVQEASADQKLLCQLFAEALHTFERQSWEEASGKFSKIINRFGQDGPSLYYLKLCERYREEPPEKVWSGVVCHDKT
jgi:adenylate cyclase